MIYSADQVMLALARFQDLTGMAARDFWLWLGADQDQLRYFVNFNVDLTLECRSGTHPKMEMLLSQHYKALMKAWQIRHDAGIEP